MDPAGGREDPQHAGSEIAVLAWLGYADRDRPSPVDQMIFDRLHGDGLDRTAQRVGPLSRVPNS